MSLKKIEQIKKDRWFRIFDLIIYGVIIISVAVLFIVMFTTQDKSKLTGVKILLKSETVFEYEFGKEYRKLSDKVEVKEEGVSLTVTVRDGDNFNEVYIDTAKKTVRMSESNCRGKHCMYFAPMSDNSDFISCSPHGVKIEPLFRDLDNPIIPFG